MKQGQMLKNSASSFSRLHAAIQLFCGLYSEQPELHIARDSTNCAGVSQDNTKLALTLSDWCKNNTKVCSRFSQQYQSVPFCQKTYTCTQTTDVIAKEHASQQRFVRGHALIWRRAVEELQGRSSAALAEEELRAFLRIDIYI